MYTLALAIQGALGGPSCSELLGLEKPTGAKGEIVLSASCRLVLFESPSRLVLQASQEALASHS
jgi:hypothetical protein